MQTMTTVGPRVTDLDALMRPSADAARARKEPLRISLRTAIYNAESQSYLAWRGLTWQFAVEGYGGAKSWRQLVTLFFEVVGLVGLEPMLAHLQTWRRQIDEQQQGQMSQAKVGRG